MDVTLLKALFPNLWPLLRIQTRQIIHHLKSAGDVSVAALALWLLPPQGS